MVAIFAPIIREALRQGARYVYHGLRAQDRAIEYTYRRTGLYNRGVVRGIKHGLIAGQVIGGTLNLGLQGIDDNGFQKRRYVPKTRKFQKAYSRTKYSNRRRSKYCNIQYHRRRRHVYTRRY